MGKVLKDHVSVSGENGVGFQGSSGRGSDFRARVEQIDQQRREERRRLRMTSDGHNEERCQCELCRGKGPETLIRGTRNLNGGWRTG